jgi:type II secretory pathway component PulK
MKHNRIVQEIKGMALVMVLVIVTVTAGMLAVIMYYSMTGSEVSGIQRRYQSAKEASLGAMDVVTKEIITRVLQQNVVGGATQDLRSLPQREQLTYASWPNSGLLQEPGLQHVRTRTPVNK